MKMSDHRPQIPPNPRDVEAIRASDNLRRTYPVIWWLTLLGPFAGTAVLLLLAAAERGTDFVIKLIGNALFTFFVLGRFAILAAGDASAAGTALRLTRVEAFGMVTWMDFCVACLLIFHGGLIFRIPYLGPRLLMLREDAEFVLHTHPWIRRFTFLGLSLFVAMPIAATGSVAGSIFARLLGLSRRAAFIALICGSLIGNGMMFLGSKVLNKVPFFDPENPLNLVLGLGAIIGVIVLLNVRYQAMKKRWATGEGRLPPSTSVRRDVA